MWHRNKRKIIFLAYCDQFVFPLISFFVPILVLSVYNIVGVLFKWKHIYCAHQSMSHKKMTPDNIEWDTVTFADKYGVPIVFVAFSIVAIVCYFINVF